MHDKEKEGFVILALDEKYFYYCDTISIYRHDIESEKDSPVFTDTDGSTAIQSLKQRPVISDDYREISPNVVKALIAAKDPHFNQHSGVKIDGGESLTLSLAKLLYYIPSEAGRSGELQQLVESMIAVKLERVYSKEEIITMYLNRFDFLDNAVGIKSAARVYFGKDPVDLTVEEAATLVGMMKNPTYFNPISKPERTRDSRNVVLNQMVKAGYISAVERDSLAALPLKLYDHNEDDD